MLNYHWWDLLSTFCIAYAISRIGVSGFRSPYRAKYWRCNFSGTSRIYQRCRSLHRPPAPHKRQSFLFSNVTQESKKKKKQSDAKMQMQYKKRKNNLLSALLFLQSLILAVCFLYVGDDLVSRRKTTSCTSKDFKIAN